MFGKTTRHRPEELKSLERSTKFTRKEIQLIYRGFKQVKFLFFSIISFFSLRHHLDVHAWYRHRSFSRYFHLFSFVCVCVWDALRVASLWKMIFSVPKWKERENILPLGRFRSTKSTRTLFFYNIVVVMILQLSSGFCFFLFPPTWRLSFVCLAADRFPLCAIALLNWR